MWVWWKAPPEAMFSWLYSQVRVQPGLIYSILITGAEFSCNHTVCSASTQSLLSSISDVFFMIKIGFLVYCSWADLLKEKCFVTFYVSFDKRKCPFSSPEEYLTPYRELALCLSRRLPSLAREESLFCCTCFKVCSFMGSWHTESLILPGTECLLQGIECPPILCSQKGVDCSWHQSNLDPEDHR